MKKIIALTMALVTGVAVAGIKEKKVVAESEQKMKEGLEIVKKACGNKSLEASMDWSQWEKYNYKNPEDKHKFMGHVGGLFEEIYGYMEGVCKGDPLYKEEIGKLTQLKFSGKPELLDYDQASFALKGTTLIIQLNADGVGSWKNEESIKKVWE